MAAVTVCSDFGAQEDKICHCFHFFPFYLPWSGEGNGTPLQYSCLENPMEGGAWSAAVYGVAKSRTWLSDFTFTFFFHALEKEMALHSSVLAWRMPGTGEPDGLPSMWSHRVGHDWSDLAAPTGNRIWATTYIHKICSKYILSLCLSLFFSPYR